MFQGIASTYINIVMFHNRSKNTTLSVCRGKTLEKHRRAAQESQQKGNKKRQSRSYLRRRARHRPPLLLLRPTSRAAGASVRVLVAARRSDAAPGGGRAAVGAPGRVLTRRGRALRVLPGSGLPRRRRPGVWRSPHRVARLLRRLPPAVRPVRVLREGRLLGGLVVDGDAVGSRGCTTAVGGRRRSR